MSVTSFSLLMPLLLVLLGGGQIAAWWHWRKFQELLWLGMAFIAISFGVLSQVLWRPDDLTLYVLAFTICYIAGFSCVGVALAFRMRVPYPWGAALVVSAVCVGLEIWYSAIAPDLPVRVFVVNAASMALSGLPLWHWHSMQARNRFDGYLRWLYVIFIGLNSLRLLITLPLSKVEHTFQFTQTLFWLSVHAFFMVLGLLVATCMFGALLHDVLKQLHIDRNTDPLTQLPNRRGWAEWIGHLRTRHAHQPHQQLAVLLVDIDHFKQVNDRFGHAMGDMVLQAVAHTMRDLVRGDDMACRIGGEEFAVLLANASTDTAQQVAERIRQQVQSIPLLEPYGIRVTVSIGLSVFQGTTAEHVEQALQAADAQMYVAKKAGRNMVAIASEQPEAQEIEKIAVSA